MPKWSVCLQSRRQHQNNLCALHFTERVHAWRRPIKGRLPPRPPPPLPPAAHHRLPSPPPPARAASHAGPAQPPTVLRGVIVRLKYARTYHLLPVEQLVAAADGTPGLAVASPTATPAAAVLSVPLSSVSGTNPLEGRHWDAGGQEEVARLAELLRQRGQPLLLPEVSCPSREGWCREHACPVYMLLRPTCALTFELRHHALLHAMCCCSHE